MADRQVWSSGISTEKSVYRQKGVGLEERTIRREVRSAPLSMYVPSVCTVEAGMMGAINKKRGDAVRSVKMAAGAIQRPPGTGRRQRGPARPGKSDCDVCNYWPCLPKSDCSLRACHRPLD